MKYKNTRTINLKVVPSSKTNWTRQTNEYINWNRKMAHYLFPILGIMIKGNHETHTLDKLLILLSMFYLPSSTPHPEPTVIHWSYIRHNSVRVIVLNSPFNNISVISWRSVLLMEEIGVPGENHRPVASRWQTLSHNVVLSTPRHERDSNSQL
jgi:hypothetical protein